MAMNKREKAALQAAIDRADMYASMHISEAVEPDVMPPEEMGESDTSGWTFNAYSKLVEEGWSGITSHGSGPGKSPGVWACQGPQKLYSTKRKALQALRHEMAVNAAEELMRIDRMIAECDGGES